jgi:hypothetical protein
MDESENEGMAHTTVSGCALTSPVALRRFAYREGRGEGGGMSTNEQPLRVNECVQPNLSAIALRRCAYRAGWGEGGGGVNGWETDKRMRSAQPICHRFASLCLQRGLGGGRNP